MKLWIDDVRPANEKVNTNGRLQSISLQLTFFIYLRLSR